MAYESLVENAEAGLETNLPQPLFIKRGEKFPP